MPSEYKTIPIFLSGFSPLTGYRCPIDKTALVKQISLANETSQSAHINIYLEDWNSVGLGTSSSNANFSTYPLMISGVSTGYSVVSALQDFVALNAEDAITIKAAQSGRVNAIFTVIENSII